MLTHLSNHEVCLELAKQLRSWRISSRGAGLSQRDLAEKAGISLTSLQRFEKTGGITLQNWVALLRALHLLDQVATMIPDPETPSPMELWRAQVTKDTNVRQRAPRTQKKPKHS